MESTSTNEFEGTLAASTFLSKSLFIRGLQCHKALFLEKFHRHLKPPVTAQAQARFDTGNQAGDAARQLFPGGILIPYMEGDEGRARQIRFTRDAIDAGASTIYEAAFQHDGIFIKADIIRRGPDGWELYEVKAGTKLTPVYVDDAAIQYHVVTAAGLDLGRAFVTRVNPFYVRKGLLDLRKLFTHEDVTDKVRERQPFIARELHNQRRMLEASLPDIDIGPHCLQPYHCDYREHCWRHIPADSVFDLAGRGADPFDLYKRGIIEQKDIPPGLLNDRQSQQVQATMDKSTAIDHAALRDFLGTLSYPLCFLDFETFMSVIPPYDGTRPYQQIPFQYSLHCRDTRGGAVRHREFLAEPGEDPREPLLQRLMADLPGDACILTWNMSFEKGILQALADRSPGQADIIETWIENMKDLMIPFRSRLVYHWRMKGSYSIKAVLPALVPDLSYDALAIADGDAAMDGYHRMCVARDYPDELERIRDDLREYCRLDTLGMVRILEVLENL